ncbi:MAG: hypothetical protein H7844_11725 [Nitrospirae bacterium YQR-1]
MIRFRVVVFLAFVMFVFPTVLYAQDIENGKKLFNSIKLGGSTSGKSCNSCHPAGKGIDGAALQTKGLEDMVNKCIEGPLMGKPLAKDSQEMKDIAAYIKSLAKTK